MAVSDHGHGQLQRALDGERPTTLLTGSAQRSHNGVRTPARRVAVNGCNSASAPVVVTPVQPRRWRCSRWNRARITQRWYGARRLSLGVPLNGNARLFEPRRADPGHTLAFRFGNAVTSAAWCKRCAGEVAVIAGFSGNDVIVQVNGVPDRSRATVSLTGVNGVLDAAVSLAFCRRRERASQRQCGGHRSHCANASMPVTPQRARFDLDLDGAVGAADAAMAKSRAGQSLP